MTDNAPTIFDSEVMVSLERLKEMLGPAAPGEIGLHAHVRRLEEHLIAIQAQLDVGTASHKWQDTQFQRLEKVVADLTMVLAFIGILAGISLAAFWFGVATR